MRRWNIVRLLTLLAAIASALCGAYLMKVTGFGTTAALYLGLPLLALVPMLLAPPPKSMMLGLMRAVTIVMLLSIPLLHEGWVCVVMAAPLLLGFAALIGRVIDLQRENASLKERAAGRLQTAALLLPFALLALEGTHPALTVERFNTVTDERVFEATPADIEARLAQVPQLPDEMPMIARIFPAPVRTAGGGLEVSDQRSVTFVYAKHVWFNVHRGRVVHEVVDRSENCVRFRAVHDSSYLSAYLRWRDSLICWEALDEQRTRVRSSVSWERKLDPAWYFGPLQRVYVGKAADVLIDALGRQAGDR